MGRRILLGLLLLCAACADDEPDPTPTDSGVTTPDGGDVEPDATVDSGVTSPDGGALDAGDAGPADAGDAGVDPCVPNPCFQGGTCTSSVSGFVCEACPTGYEGDGVECRDVDGCQGEPCFAGVLCTDVPAPGEGFNCGACPPGLEGDGIACTEIDGCAGAPCLPSTSCTDVPAPGDGFVCSVCVGAACPILRALAGPDRQVVAGSVNTLMGSATGYNGAFRCDWRNDVDGSTWSTCTPTVAPTADTVYTLTVTDASALTATDDVVFRVADLIADAGPDSNIRSSATATLTASWSGASCANGSCIDCAWRLSNGTPVASTCTATVSPTATTQYFLTVTDNVASRSAQDSATVFVTDQPAQLCGWDVVVMTSDEYPTGANPNYICDSTGTARRQTVNGKPAIVLSDLVVQNVRITGHISVETSSDDDLIGFLWGWQSPKQTYLLTWKQLSQNWTARCGNAPAGIAIKKVDGSTTAPSSIRFNPSFGYNATDYVYSCAVGWSQSRANAGLLNDNTIFLWTPGDPGGVTVGWSDFITYRFEFYYTPERTRILVYSDDQQTGSTANLVASLLVEDSSFPAGAFAFFSNSQEQVAFGDFRLASLSDFQADAGPDQQITAGQTADLAGTAMLAVPPYLCEWSDGAMTLLSSDCALQVTPTVDTTYTLTVTDDFGRVSTDQVEVRVIP